MEILTNFPMLLFKIFFKKLLGSSFTRLESFTPSQIWVNFTVLKMWSLIQCCVCRYSFACVGINLTHMSYRMWKDGTAKTHVYNACHQTHAELPDISHFHRFYCYLYFEFDKLWLSEKPTNIMDFSRIRDMFEERVRLLLADRSALLKLNFSIDQIWKQRHSQSPFLAFIQFWTGRFPQIYAYRLFIDLINICWENVVYCLNYPLSGSRNWMKLLPKK